MCYDCFRKQTVSCNQCLKLLSTLSELGPTTTILYCSLSWNNSVLDNFVQFCTVHCQWTIACVTFCTMISCITWYTGKSQSRLFRLTLVSFLWWQHVLCYVTGNLKYIYTMKIIVLLCSLVIWRCSLVNLSDYFLQPSRFVH